MAKILITGGTGLIGAHLCPLLEERGFEIALLSRGKNPSSGYHTYRWDPDKGEIENEAIESADYIIHLAGANIGDKRWTSEQKKLIIDSRVQSANLIFEKVKQIKGNLKAFISSSAVGYYGSASSDKIFYETDPPGNGFLSEVCAKWEKAADQFQKLDIRTVKIRSGVVLTKKGGVLSQMKIPVQLGFGSMLGNGKQFVPWIHIKDLCLLYVRALEDNQMLGPYNGVAPDIPTNAEFMHLTAEVLNKPFWFPPVPGLLLKILLGERSSIVLDGNRVSCEKVMKEGFNFKFPDLVNALKDLLD